MRVIALHGAGEGFLAASVVETGVQENALKCLNPPVESVFLNMLLTIKKIALHGAGEAFSCYFCALMKPCDAQDGLMNSPYKQLLKMASPFCQNWPSRSSETRVLTKSLVL